MSVEYTSSLLQSLDSETTFDYSSICEYILKFLNRNDTDTVNAIPQFITLAQSRLATDLKITAGIQTARFTISPTLPSTISGTVIVDKPSLWRETKSMSVINSTGRSYIYPRSYEYVQTYMNDVTPELLRLHSNMEELTFYADIDQEHWIFAPFYQDNTYEMEVQYFSTIPTLNSVVTQNYWTQYAPRCLIYASLVEASYYLRSDSRTLNSWENIYKESLGQLSKQNADNFNDNSNHRIS